MKKIVILAAVMIAAGACSANSEEAPAKSEPPISAAAQADAAGISSATQDPESALVLAEYGDYQFASSDWRPTLAQFDQWAAQWPDGYSRFGVSDEPHGRVIFGNLSWRRDNGEVADYGFVWNLSEQNRTMDYFLAFEGEQRLSREEGERVLSGIILDMYHRGMLPPLS